jgi:carbamoyltransferase
MEVEKQLLKPVLALYSGHDTNFTVYEPKYDKFYIFEFERILGKKHYRGSDVNKTTGMFSPIKRDFNIITYEYFIEYLKEAYDIDNDFSFYSHRNRGSDLKDYGQNIFKYDKESNNHCYHHEGHTWSAYMQSPFDSAFVMSWDGGGDGTCFQVSKIVNGEMIYSERRHWDFGSVYWYMFGHSKSFERTDPLDIAGKIMGLSAYGKVHKPLFPYIDDIARWKNFPKFLHDMWKAIPEIDYDQVDFKKACRPRNDRVRDDFVRYVNKYNKNSATKIKEKDLAATVQVWLEQKAIEIIKEKFYDQIKECDGNLIITGGCALNVLVNQKIKETFPDINVYVPPNPHDGGISVGMAYKYLIENGYIPRGKKYDLSNSGPQLLDIKNFNNHLISKLTRHSIIPIDKFVKGMHAGKIIGMLQGNMEIGPRALGRRSILCWAAHANMKNTINSKVKFREEYRPFAPMCRLEDAHKYFDAVDFDNTEAMAYTVNVKREYRKVLKSITHEDNTARVQTVTEKSDPLMYEILSKLSEPKVLLNTSFNVQGKPILNTLAAAEEVLQKTELDGYVLYYDEKLFYFLK